MEAKTKKIISITLRTVVCVGAMVWVLSKVHYNDWAFLPDGRQLQITKWYEEVRDDERLDDADHIDEVAIKVWSSTGQTTEITLGELARNDEGKPHFEIGLKSAWKSSDKKYLIWIAMLIYAPIALLQSIRFTWMVRAQDIELSYWEGIKLSYAGNFMNFIALGSTGGDIYKAYYVSTHTTHKTEAVTTVFLDRAVGLISLLIIAAGAMLLKFDDPKIRSYAPFIGVLMLALLVGAVAVFSRRTRAVLHVDGLLTKLPFSAQLQRIDATTRRMRNHKKLLAMALLITLLLQGLAVTSITVTAIGLGMNSNLSLIPGYFTYIALALLIAAVPISYQGGGTMDGALQIFFSATYGNYSQILFVGFAIRILQLMWSLPGILVPITGVHRSSSDKIAQLQSLTGTAES